MKQVSFGAKPKPTGRRVSADEWVKSRPGGGEALKQEEEAMKRLTIDIPVSLHTRVKSQCALENVKMADVIRDYLEQRFGRE